MCGGRPANAACAHCLVDALSQPQALGIRPSAPSAPSPAPFDPLEALGLTAEELGERYALEIGLCVKYVDVTHELDEREQLDPA